MKRGEFSKLLSMLDGLTPLQRTKLGKKLKEKESKQESADQCIPAAIADAIVEQCPHCGHDKLHKHGHASGLQRWLCTGCKKTFNALTGTPLAHLRMKERWIDNAEAMITGLSLKKTAKRCKVSENTAFHWRHRFLQNQNKAQSRELVGIAESDETYFYYSEKGKKQPKGQGRKPRKRGGDNVKRGSAELIPVIVLRDRSGNGADRVVTKDDKYKDKVRELFCKHLAKDTLLTTDGKRGLCSAARFRDSSSHVCVVGKKSRGGAGKPFHIQTANSFHSMLKGWMARFRGVATKYLEHYVGWHRHLKEGHHQNDPNLFIQLSFKPLAINPQLTSV